MAKIGEQLDSGASMPDVTWNLMDGSTYNLKDDLNPRWTVLIVLRGDW